MLTFNNTEGGILPNNIMDDKLQLSLSTRATVGTEESGRGREVAGEETLKQESMYELSVQEVAVSGGSTVLLIYNTIIISSTLSATYIRPFKQ